MALPISKANMNQDVALAKLKRDVRSLLISSKMGLAPDQLRRDYATMLGHPMPLKALGFRHVMDMVKEMPEVVSVDIRHDGSIFLKAVSSEATQNIQELVAKQRTSKADKMKRDHASPRYFHRAPVVLPRRGPAPLALHPNLRAQLRLLLTRGPLKLSDLESAFLHNFGYQLRAHNHGFFSVGEMLAAAADLVIIHQGIYGSVVTLREHMRPRPLLTPFNTPPWRTGPIKPQLPRSGKTAVKGPNITVETPVPARQSPQRQATTVTAPGTVHQDSPSVRRVPEVVEKSQEEEPKGGLFQAHVLKLEEKLCQQILENGVAGTINQELKEKLKKVVGQTSGGLSVHNLPEEYKRLFGEELPLLKNGFVSVIELVGAMSDIFHLQPTQDDNGHHWIVTHKQDRAKSDFVGSDDMSGVFDGVKAPFKSHYLSSRESPWESKVEEEEEDVLTADDDESLETSNESKPQVKVSEVYPAIQVHSIPDVPLDALQSQRLKQPTWRQTRELAGVLVEEVVSPGHFYIRFVDETQDMEDMMMEIRRCYTCPQVSKRYRLPERYVRRGQVCCVSPTGMWFYRVVIHQVISHMEVQVYYVDYGVMTIVNTADLKFLKSCHSVLPAQAVPSSLAGIKPTTGTWTAEATAALRKLCCDRTLVGALDCYSGDTLQLYLCDTHDQAEDIYFHKVLLNQGHGVACSSSASAALCFQSTPVSLYLGEGLADLPDVELTISGCKPADKLGDTVMDTLQIEEEELPALESLEDIEFSFNSQCEDGSRVNALHNYQTSPWIESGWALTNDTPTLCSSNPTFSPQSPPDVIQTEKMQAHHEHDEHLLEALNYLPTASSADSSRQAPKEEKLRPKLAEPGFFSPPTILRTLNLYTPSMAQTPTRSVDFSSPLYMRKSGKLFPLFGAW